MTQGYYTGISALMAQQSGIDVTANNLSNADAVGFKGNGIEFQSLFENAVSSSSKGPVNSTIGVGVGLQATPTILKEGTINNTGNGTDLAINGEGWFGLQGQGQTMYTRNGIFNFGASRDLVNADGYYVLGTLASNFNANNVLTSKQTTTNLGTVGSQTSIKLPETLTYPAEPTTLVSFTGNLGQADATQTMGATIIDAQGNKNALSLTFTKTVPQPASGLSWDVTAKTSSPTTSNSTATIYDTVTGTMLFDSTGSLLSSTLGSINNNGTAVTLNLGTGYTGITSNDTPISSSSQVNGLLQGDLIGYKINENAEVIAAFTNGRQVSMAKIGVFHFANDQGLNNINGTNFLQSANSGKPLFYQDANGNNINGSTVMTNTLESSNVDPTAGLTDLIIYQRAYDAAAKLITTGDQMIQKALQMHK
ncbi:MAG: flagellar hook-basal body complex protein [Thiovulaceae bacterium]|nr:flagellar hook-basal body complex protein [Sulfurimonadaceae bacterium]